MKDEELRMKNKKSMGIIHPDMNIRATKD